MSRVGTRLEMMEAGGEKPLMLGSNFDSFSRLRSQLKVRFETSVDNSNPLSVLWRVLIPASHYIVLT